jgi:hypothetical protein
MLDAFKRTIDRCSRTFPLRAVAKIMFRSFQSMMRHLLGWDGCDEIRLVCLRLFVALSTLPCFAPRSFLRQAALGARGERQRAARAREMKLNYRAKGSPHSND